MELSTTPRTRFLRRKFVSPAASSPYRNPFAQSIPDKEVESSIQNISLEELKASTKELWQKNEILEEKIKDMQNKGHTEEDVKSYIEKLHTYNYRKDFSQIFFGKIALIKQITIKEVYEEFGMRPDE